MTSKNFAVTNSAQGEARSETPRLELPMSENDLYIEGEYRFVRDYVARVNCV